jgi:hypothetical protein
MSSFHLWLEFEAVDPGNWDPANEAANILVTLPDGRRYGLNVWTYRFLETIIRQDQASGAHLHGLYQTPPDLFVRELTRECLEKTVADLLKQGDLEVVLNPGVKTGERR